MNATQNNPFGEFYYTEEGIRKVTALMLRKSLMLRAVFFLLLIGYAIYSGKDARAWWIPFVPAFIVGFLFFVVSPLVMKQRLKKYLQSVVVRINNGQLYVEQMGIRPLLLRAEDIVRITKDSSRRRITIHCHHEPRKLVLYTYLNDPENFELLLAQLCPISPQPAFESRRETVRNIIIIVLSLFYLPLFWSHNTLVVVLSFIAVAGLTIFNISLLARKINLLEGDLKARYIFIMIVTILFCLFAAWRVFTILQHDHRLAF